MAARRDCRGAVAWAHNTSIIDQVRCCIAKYSGYLCPHRASRGPRHTLHPCDRHASQPPQSKSARAFPKSLEAMLHQPERHNINSIRYHPVPVLPLQARVKAVLEPSRPCSVGCLPAPAGPSTPPVRACKISYSNEYGAALPYAAVTGMFRGYCQPSLGLESRVTPGLTGPDTPASASSGADKVQVAQLTHACSKRPVLSSLGLALVSTRVLVN